MRHLSVTGDFGSPGRNMDQSDRFHCSRLRDVQPCSHSFHHERMVHREVWEGESGIQMENDTVRFLETNHVTLPMYSRLSINA